VWALSAWLAAETYTLVLAEARLALVWARFWLAGLGPDVVLLAVSQSH